MSHVLLTQSHPSEFTPHRRGVKWNIGPVTAVILMMILIALMGLLSLTHLNAMSTKGYVINKLEDEQQQLVEDGEINDMLILNARSMRTIESSLLVQNMRQPEYVYYVDSVTGFAQAGDQMLAN